jgi:hypothetical protein
MQLSRPITLSKVTPQTHFSLRERKTKYKIVLGKGSLKV